MRKFLSLTAVAYEAGDHLGHFLAYCTLLPLALLVAEATALFLAESGRRRVRAGLFLTGQLVNEALNLFLKYSIQEPRPNHGHGRGDYGMPSSHSQFMGYFLLVAWALFAPQKSPEAAPFARNTLPVTAPDWDIIALGLLMMMTQWFNQLIWLLRVGFVLGSATVWISRIYLGYHTIQQVVVGAMVGAVVGWLVRRLYHVCPFFASFTSKSE